MAVLSKILRVGEGRVVKRLSKLADDIVSMEDDYADLTDDQLRAKTEEFKDRIADGETVDDLLPEAFAVAREASWRVLGQKHYPVQIMGGAALHEGQVAEMKTGEGKTLTCVLPAYLNALEGKGVHIVTVNDYLAKRDAEWMGRVHRFLGLEVGVILSDMEPEERRKAYNADITYGTNNEFGFDYLRDNMAHSTDDLVQREHHYAIVDEVDSILIDEARTPLIISGPSDSSSQWYQEFARLAPMMEKDKHYEVDIRKRTVGITEAGVAFVEDQLGIDNLYESANSPLVSYLNNSIKAKELFTRDKDYMVVDGEVLIIDEFTGRALAGRRYNEGMHQAIEAKEGVEVKAENQTLATITLQNYFRMYDKLAGMTGTAETEAAELHQIYKLGVVPIPTNKPLIRKDQRDLIYKTQEAKFEAVADDIAERHEKGQPVLVGTVSVERSEYLSKLLQKRGIKHNVLNAKRNAEEALTVASAGRVGAVTVSTNMAGRGTDIVLGGNPDVLTDAALRKRGLDPVEDEEAYQQAWEQEIINQRKKAEEAAEKVREVGGLYVIGTERHESRRIDNQLRGRSGRQGDPGESRFYLSLGDDLMRRFNGRAVETLMERLQVPDNQPIDSRMVTKAIKNAQTSVESQNFEIRKNVLKYDDVQNKQRQVIYAERKRILEGEDLQEQVEAMLDEVLEAYVKGATENGYVEDWDLDSLWTALRQLYPVGIDYQDLIDGDEYGQPGDLTAEELLLAIRADARAAYEAREEAIEAIGGDDAMRQVERSVLLQVLDRKWREHLYEMDYLKEGIGLRAMAQRDPLTEYQREGYEMFDTMMDGLKEESIAYLFSVGVEPADNRTDAQRRADEEALRKTIRAKGEAKAALRAAAMSLAGPNEQGDLSSNQEEQQPVPRSRAQRRAAKRATRKKGNIRQK